MTVCRLAHALPLAAALAAIAGCKERAKEPAAAPSAPAADLDTTDSKKLLAAVDRMAGQLKDKPKSFEVLAALGNLYYENGRYLEAVDSFRQALELSAKVEGEADALRAKGVKPARELPLECRRSGPAYGLAQIAEQARNLAASDPAAALRCDDEALVQATAARARRGNALYLVGQPDGALREHQRVLMRAPDYPESLFFVGAITLEQSKGDKAQLEEGKKYWRRLLQVAPDHPRADIVRESLPKADELFARKPVDALAAGAQGGGGALPPNHPPLPSGADDGRLRSATSPETLGGEKVAGNVPGAPMAHRGAAPGEPGAAGQGQGQGPSPEMIRNLADAAAQTERTPELEKGLDDLTAQAEASLDQGKYQDARDRMVRVMPLRPQDARTAADLGAAMRGLGRADMAERVLRRALELDPRQPRALYELGRLSAERGDKAAALERLTAVQSADPKFAQAHGVAAEIARLK
jgi:tetratricopeptide (TPR) repeat protein